MKYGFVTPALIILIYLTYGVAPAFSHVFAVLAGVSIMRFICDSEHGGLKP